ncbi:MAG: flagellar basal body P-ring formation chaperone FlgA [Gammaproteobacteria bacterium]
MKLALFTTLVFSTSLALAGPAPARQDPAALRQVAEQFLQGQSAGLPGQVTITVGNIDARMNLAACAAPEAFQQPGAKPWGKTTVGVRCTAPVAWTVYIQAQVSVLGQYVAAAVPLAAGKPIDATQLVMVSGDLGTLPNGVATELSQAVGRTSAMPLAAGAPLRIDMLRSQPVVQQGQAVRVVSKGAGFSVSAEARAIGTAGDGQVVQVRAGNGAILSGVARAGGTVEVVF